MSAGLFLTVALAGGVGAGLRWIVDSALTPRSFPWAILAVNVSGSLLLGALIGAAAAIEASVATIVGTGLLGGYTTFSTVMVESVLMWRRGARRLFWGNVVGTAVGALGAAAAGVVAGAWIVRSLGGG